MRFLITGVKIYVTLWCSHAIEIIVQWIIFKQWRLQDLLLICKLTVLMVIPSHYMEGGVIGIATVHTVIPSHSVNDVVIVNHIKLLKLWLEFWFFNAQGVTCPPLCHICYSHVFVISSGWLCCKYHRVTFKGFYLNWANNVIF